MSVIVDRAIEAAGFGSVLAARREGRLPHAIVQRLSKADLLVLGALADCVRREEVGDEVRIYTGEETPAGGGPFVLISRGDSELTGLELLREVAVRRVTGARGLHVRVDWTSCGLELAQVALGFGANELSGCIANKRGLPIAADALVGVGKKSQREPARLAKRKEVAGYVERAGRVPVFVDDDGAAGHALAQDEAKRSRAIVDGTSGAVH